MFDAGYLMYASGDGFLATAKLEYSVNKLAALGCQMRYFFLVNKSYENVCDSFDSFC